MKRTKMKNRIPAGTPGGQQNISAFFSLKGQKFSPSSLKAYGSVCALVKTGPQNPDNKSSLLRHNSPSKRNMLGDLENMLPSSPDLLLLVPETPNSQIRSTSSSSSREENQDPGRKVANLGQLSPICRSPSSKGQRIKRSRNGKGESTKLGGRLSSSLKRLFSPPEDSCMAKKARIDSLQEAAVQAPGSSQEELQPLRPFVKALSGDQPNKSPLQMSSDRVMVEQQEHQEEQDRRESNFTVITEMKTAEVQMSRNLHRGLQNACTPFTGGQESSANTPFPVKDPKEKETTRTQETDEDPNNKRSTDEEHAGAADAASAHPAEDDFDDSWFMEQMDQMENKPKKPCKLPDHVILSGGPNNRYWVVDVEDGPGYKKLIISCSRTLHPTETCLLKDGWETTPVRRGDVVHLEGRSDAGTWLVERDQGFLVLQPDSLISGTSISNSIRCMRRAVLGEMFKSFDGGSKQMLNGTMVHEVFQGAAKAKDFSSEKLFKLADEALHSPRYLGDMYTLGVSQEEMKQELLDYLPSLENWASEYLSSSKPKSIGLKILNPSRAPGGCQESNAVVTVTDLTDIEENVWSPRFGLKGKIDVTAQVQIQRPRTSRSPEEKTFPLELKTGRESNSIEHRSQVILYTLMSMERYNPEAGLLLYLKTGSMHPVAPSHMDRRELLKLRNTLAHHLHNSVEKGADLSNLQRLPDILTSRQTCQYCPQKLNCALYERALDPSSADPSDDVRDFLQQECGHLAQQHLNYFSHWLLLCILEAVTMETKNSRKHIWLQSIESSEKNGSCVGNLQLKDAVAAQAEDVFLHRFQRTGSAPSQSATNCGLTNGDRIVVSDQDGRLVGLATGYLCEVDKTSVSCTLSRDLSKFRDVLFRLDADEGVVGMSTHLTNLSRLMENCQDSERLRKLIVDLRPPEFIFNLSSVLPRDAKETVADILKGLNKPQKQAMKKVLLSKDYTLIVGMPGTGKTTTICTLVRILQACGFSVLLTSYTHSAVDNILLKLKRFRVGFLRLGQGQKIHPDILPYTEENVRKKGVHTLLDLEQLYNKELVVATTCMGIKHPIFTRRRFDYCIVDEASQISQPICLGPLFYAHRFVLVGDHQQLPPIVQNKEARSLGMDESLFKRLEVHGEAVVQLNVQYRMNRQIMSLSNSLMYDGRLECGSERTAAALLTLPSLASVQSELRSHSETHPQHDLSWVQFTLLPSNPVCFLDCSLVPALESVEQGGVSNHTEAALIHMLLSLLIKAGCRPSDVGVIAPYRQQLKTIQALLQSPTFSGLEVNTVDKYQGRDKSLIVLSFVRSNTEEGHLGELLKDWRRLNVAITRAKHKLLMVGSAVTLRRFPPVEKLLDHLQQEDMISFKKNWLDLVSF
uniref:DNA replication ATP-dependent helicase/nuclease n=1 Tax=Oryzias sinensis TaxID=183150 RepID=A0A8C7Y3M3_9TELE